MSGDDRFVGVGLVQDASPVVGRILKVGFTDTDDESREIRELRENLIHHGAEEFVGLRVKRVAECLLNAEAFDQGLGKKHEVAHCVGFNSRGPAFLKLLAEARRLLVHPLAALRTGRKNPGIHGFPVDRQTRRIKKEKDFAVEPHLRQHRRILVF